MTTNRHLQLSIEHEKAARENITLARFNGIDLVPRQTITTPEDGLWKGIWEHSEVACLFGLPNVGKTILAMQIATNAKEMGLRVDYFDLEGLEHPVKPQFTPTTMPLSDNEEVTPLDFIIKNITVKKTQVAIIDDFDLLLNGDNSTANVKSTLNSLRQLSRSTSAAILIIAHSRPHKKGQVITTNCLPNAYEIMHVCDSVFSLAQANRHNATHHKRTHYIKQHKNRMAPVIYDDNCVLSAELTLHDGIVEFDDFKPLGNERQLLRDYGFHSHESVYEAIRQLNRCHYTTREIAAIVGISQSQVSRTIKRYLPNEIEPEVIACEKQLKHNFRQCVIKQSERARLYNHSHVSPDASHTIKPQQPQNKPQSQPTQQEKSDASESNHASESYDAFESNDAFESTKHRFNTSSSVKKMIKKSRRAKVLQHHVETQNIKTMQSMV